jgi:hypothetical protein
MESLTTKKAIMAKVSSAARSRSICSEVKEGLFFFFDCACTCWRGRQERRQSKNNTKRKIIVKKEWVVLNKLGHINKRRKRSKITRPEVVCGSILMDICAKIP